MGIIYGIIFGILDFKYTEFFSEFHQRIVNSIGIGGLLGGVGGGLNEYFRQIVKNFLSMTKFSREGITFIICQPISLLKKFS